MAKRSQLPFLLLGALACSDGPAAIELVTRDSTPSPPDIQATNPVEVARELVSDALVRDLAEALPGAAIAALWDDVDRAVAGEAVDREALAQALARASEALAVPPDESPEPGPEDDLLVRAALGLVVDRALELARADS